MAPPSRRAWDAWSDRTEPPAASSYLINHRSTLNWCRLWTPVRTHCCCVDWATHWHQASLSHHTVCVCVYVRSHIPQTSVLCSTSGAATVTAVIHVKPWQHILECWRRRRRRRYWSVRFTLCSLQIMKQTTNPDVPRVWKRVCWRKLNYLLAHH